MILFQKKYIKKIYRKKMQGYQLSFLKDCHARDMRCIDYYNGVLVSGGSDKMFHMYSVKCKEIQHIATSDVFEKNVLSVRINRRGGNVFAFVGSVDGKIHAFDSMGTPIALYEHDSAISSIDCIDEGHFVTGSWDGKAIVWETNSMKKVAEYTNHKHAVSVHYDVNTKLVISGSQDKALNSWKWQNGELVKRVPDAHGDIIREICQVHEVGFVTCSNDETIKLWTSDLELMETFHGHTSFVFTVKALGLGKYFSGGDDRTLKIWENDACVQTIQFPASIWSLVLDEKMDIYAGCSDGMLRVFTLQNERKAAAEVVEKFQKETLQASSKKSGMTAEEISKLPNTSQMGAISGKKQGQIRVFKNGTTPEAYMWQNGKWDKIGEVITEGGQSEGISQPKYYSGDKYFDAGEYDHIFDVEDDSGIRKQLPFNDGGNPLEAAEKYCMREGMSKGNLEQIRKFLMQNASNISRKAVKESTKQVSPSSLTCTPQCIPIEYNDIKNPAGLFKKIVEFNGQIEDNTKLHDKQLEHCERIVNLLENSKTYHTWKLDFKEMDTIRKLLTWPKEFKLPTWDILRAFLAHYQSESLFSGLDAGIDIISQLAAGLERNNPQAIYSLIFKTLSNSMLQNTNKNGILKHADIIFSSVLNFSQKKELQNKNLLAAIAGFIYNLSISFVEKKVQNEKIIVDFAEIIKVRIAMDGNEENQGTMLQGAANTISKYQDTRNAFQFLKPYLRGDDVSKDLKLLLG